MSSQAFESSTGTSRAFWNTSSLFLFSSLSIGSFASASASVRKVRFVVTSSSAASRVRSIQKSWSSTAGVLTGATLPHRSDLGDQLGTTATVGPGVGLVGLPRFEIFIEARDLAHERVPIDA